MLFVLAAHLLTPREIMSLLSIHNLTKSYGAQVLFEKATLQLHAGYRYAIAGANGSGKSTLLKIMAGLEEPTDGEATVPRKVRVGFLKQDHFQYEKVSILHVVMMGIPELWDAMQEKEQILANAETHFDGDRYAACEDIVLQYDGYTMEATAGEILEGLNIPTAQHHLPLSTLSGGFKLRVLMAQTLVSNPDLLLLDEPTNHLDILSIRWLEKFLTKHKGCTVVVSHDRRFLNRICTHVIDVDYQRVTLYRGNYDAFEHQKQEDRDRKESEIAAREKEIASHKAFVDRFKAKPSKARQANSKAKRMQKIIIDDLPRSSRRYPRFLFRARRSSGKQVVDAKNISKSYGEKEVLRNVSLQVARGDRLAIIGPNGIGKSTLLKIMMNLVEANAGEVEWGYEANPGYFSQDHEALRAAELATVRSWLWDRCSDKGIGFVLGKLAEVLFSKDETDKKVQHLSGGEKARLVFSSLSVLQPTVMLLDEPTNHLDIEGIESLAKGLEAYDGTLIFVSHNRWFVERLATRILELTPDGAKDFMGTYREYLQHCGDDHLDVDTVVKSSRRAKKSKKKR